MSFEQFKTEFSSRTEGLIIKWAKESYVPPIPVYIIPDEKLDPYRVGAFYVREGWCHSGVKGPAVVFPEGYLRDLYQAAATKDMLEDLWTVLKWTSGHEFGHHISLLEVAGLLFPGPVARKSREVSASAYALALSGISKLEHNALFKDIMGKPPRIYVREKYRGRAA